MANDSTLIEDALAEIIDPELGLSILELKLIEDFGITAGHVDLQFHTTSPFCPPMFALKIAQDIKEGLLRIEGVSGATVTLAGHFLADHVNDIVNRKSLSDSQEFA